MTKIFETTQLHKLFFCKKLNAIYSYKCQVMINLRDMGNFFVLLKCQAYFVTEIYSHVQFLQIFFLALISFDCDISVAQQVEWVISITSFSMICCYQIHDVYKASNMLKINGTEIFRKNESAPKMGIDQQKCIHLEDQSITQSMRYND